MEKINTHAFRYLLTVIVALYASLFFFQPLWSNALVVGTILLTISVLSLAIPFFSSKKTLPVAFILSMVIIIFFIFLGEAHNDYFRYLWDAWLTQNGISPYIFTPSEIATIIPRINNVWYWNLLDFKNTYTIYGTTSQVFFYIGGIISSNTLFGLRIINVILAGGILTLLYQLSMLYQYSAKWVQFVILSPLFLFDGIAGIHTEITLTFFLLLALWFHKKNKSIGCGISLALMVMTKFFPVILIPFFITKQNWKKLITSFTLSIIILFLPILYQNGLQQIITSLKRFSSQWVASPGITDVIYSSIQYLRIPLSTNNIQFLLYTLLLIILIWIWRKKLPIADSLFFALATFLFLSQTIFSWYWLPLLMLFPFVKSTYKYAILLPIIVFPFQYARIEPSLLNGTFTYINNAKGLGLQLFFWLPAYFTLLYIAIKNHYAS